jgi:hypothetical protein
VQRKFFPLDKNYVLEQVQLDQEEDLLRYLVDFVKVEYLMRHNPLGLMDETIARILQYHACDFSRLHDLYITLAGVFRFRYYHHNQLSFIFTGEEPCDVYTREWRQTFKKWIKELSRSRQFLLGVLELTVFYPSEHEERFICSRLKASVAGFFELKIHQQSGYLRSA